MDECKPLVGGAPVVNLRVKFPAGDIVAALSTAGLDCLLIVYHGTRVPVYPFRVKLPAGDIVADLSTAGSDCLLIVYQSLPDALPATMYGH